MSASYPFATRMQGLKSSAIRDLLRDAQRPGMISLAGGLPAPDLFDIEGLKQCTNAALTDAPISALQYGLTDGQPALKSALVKLMAQRQCTITEDQPVITTGSQQAQDLLARVLLDDGDVVLLEKPTYLAALQTFALCKARFVSIPVDADGACVDQLDAALASAPAKPKLAYIISTFANPTGATLTLERRKALLQWAVKNQIFVIEDDPYGELRSEGSPLPPLIEIAKSIPGASDWCGYISSFSKIVAPGFRIGWMIVPPALRDACVRVKQAVDLHTPTFTQEVAARYLESGRLQERLPMMRDSYRVRRDALANALTSTFGSALQFNRPQGGMFLWGHFTGNVNARELLVAARDENMIFVPGEFFYASDADTASIRLSYATGVPEQLEEAVKRLARGFDKVYGAQNRNMAKAA